MIVGTASGSRTPARTLAAMRLRSLLFAPGNKGEVLAKLPRSGPDGVVLDLEDAVPADAKAEARAVVAEVAPTLVAENPDLAVFVRVNAVPSEWFGDDLAAVGPDLTGVVVPKLESAEQVATVVGALPEGLLVVAGLETAAGVARAEEVLADDRVVAAYFGAEDFVADMGGVRTAEGTEVLYARSAVALAARLTGTLAIDQVVTDLQDEDRFRADAAVGRSLGYRGKLCIHPAQVAWAHESFSPSEEELDRARRLIDAYDQAKAAGTAAIAFEGQMVDEPLARQAQALLDAAG
jgi:citrate lyase subunit beta/citryl-CoA lyase